MVHSQLSTYRGSDPIWGFVALVRSELFTGEAAVGLDPRVRLFAVEGRIYFAEREDDPTVGSRLVSCGVLSDMQLARGAVRAGEHESLARLFQRDITIDRDAVELTIASATESLLASIAQLPVGLPEVYPLRHHVAGLHHWLFWAPTAIEEAPEEPAPLLAAEEPAQASLPDVTKAAQTITVPPITVPPITVPPVLVPPVLATAPPRAVAPPAPISPPAPPAAAGLPKLAPINSATLTIPNPPAPTRQPTPEYEPAPETFNTQSLPKLATSPISMNDLKTDAETSEPWTTTSNNMAAVHIWEMVDDLFEDPQQADLRVGSGAPQARSRGWLRKKH